MSQPTDVSLEAYKDQVRAMIRDHGWAIQTVAPTVQQPYSYAYTIGLVQRGATAELLVAGLPIQQAVEILNQVAASLMNQNFSGSAVVPPSEWELPLGYKLKSKVFIPRPGSQLHVGVIRAYYGAEVPVVQYIWPDPQHRYPGDEGWDPALVQPVGNGDDLRR